MCHGGGEKIFVLIYAGIRDIFISSLPGVSGLICARESSSVFTLFPIDFVDPLEASLESYYSFSST